MANNPFKAVGIIAGAALGVASAAYGAQKIIVRTLANTSVDFEFSVAEQFVLTTSDGTRLVLYRDGPRDNTKPTILFLHGYALCSPIWAHQFDLLRDTHDVIAMDLRGHGASSVGEDGITLAAFADDVYETMNQLELEDVVLVGHSTGGVMAMSYLNRYAEHASHHVRGLCLVSTLAHPPYHHMENISEALAKFSLTGHAFHFLSDIPLIGFPLARYALGNKASNAVVEFVRRCIVSTDRDVCIKVLQMLAEFNFLSTLEQFVAPSAVIVGTSDPVTPLSDAEKVARALGTTEIIINGVGHCPMLESPDEFNTALIEFLDKTGEFL